ncbi:MAG: DNA helicase RecG, partial [Chloroflexi bacterium]|nr:DNA helicase RecG [Chloroflexota bacterium]
MASPDLDTLKKILSLERQKGCNDTAVMGGLDRFLSRWTEGLPVALPSEGYAALSDIQRRRWLEESLRLIDASASLPVPRVATARKLARSTSSRTVTRRNAAPEHVSLASAVTALPRVTPALAGKLKRLGVQTIRDLLYLFPRRHNDFGKLCTISQLEVESEQTVMVNVWEARETLLGGRLKATEAVVGDGTGNLRVVWFNQPYLARRFEPGTRLVLSGRVSAFKGSLVLESPEYEALQEGEDLTHTGRLVPVYPLTDGLTSRTMRRLAKETLDTWAHRLQDPLPEPLRQRAELPEL